ncbi:sugar kinase [Bradyrhizobium sp. LHD-71]|uniref:sugar kinase n=1 Tax=Bradyrhizobium sp. LHD-71 TaxID=3072141 RepID=UPI00280C5CA5|nr:sugar kinase [Bradyrhizobium sp. LHD-71]MDQ8727271.1 sugar kinase [Bradyrhizobium sp. LHD-71]
MTSPRQPDRKPPRILCIGIPVRDMVHRITDLPGRGEKVRADHFDELAGGNALNSSIGIARLGGRAVFCGPSGDASETSNRYIFEQVAKEGIELNALPIAGTVTPVSNVMIDPSGERTVVTFRDPRLWEVKLPDPDELLTDCAAVLTENRCAGFATDLCIEASRRNIPVVLDADVVMSMREGLLQAASHLIFSTEALSATAGSDNLEEALRRLAEHTSSFLAVTRGAQGMMWLDEAGRIQTMPTFPVHTVDTLGAGDVFHGAYALAVAEGRSIVDAMRFASAAAALKCTRFGGAFAAPTRAETEALLARGTAKVAGS